MHVRNIALLAISYLLFLSMSHSAEETIKGFHLSNCKGSFCTKLQTRVSLKSGFDNTYSFADAKLTTFKNSKVTKYSGRDGYFDLESNRIILRQINNSKKDLVLNLNTGKIIFFRN